MNNPSIILYIAVMAGVTYLLRMLPMTLIKTKIKSRFLKSFIFYVPYAVLSAMTLPAIFYCTDDLLPSLLGFIAAVTVSLFGKSLLTVAVTASLTVLASELILTFIPIL